MAPSNRYCARPAARTITAPLFMGLRTHHRPKVPHFRLVAWWCPSSRNPIQYSSWRLEREDARREIQNSKSRPVSSSSVFPPSQIPTLSPPLSPSIFRDNPITQRQRSQTNPSPQSPLRPAPSPCPRTAPKKTPPTRTSSLASASLSTASTRSPRPRCVCRPSNLVCPSACSSPADVI